MDCLVLSRHPSGVERAVSGLLEGLAALEAGDHRITILLTPAAWATPGTVPFFASFAKKADCPPLTPLEVLTAPAWTRWRPGRVFYEQAVLPGVLRALRADLLHGAAYVLPLRWEGPGVVTVHDTITLTHPEWCKPLNVRHYRAVMTRSARRAAAVVVPSAHAQDAVVEHIGVDRACTSVVPLGVGEQFRPAPTEAVARLRERYRLPERYLLCVGNLEPRKNLPAIIEAFEVFAGEAPHGLVLAGKRGWRCGPVLRAMGQSPVAGRIRWLGWVPSGELAALYSGAEALVQWSLDEGFGLPPLEAMACGTPAVISDGGALPEVAGEAALTVPLSAGPQGLAAELARLAQDGDLRAQMIERGRTYAAQFTWPRHAERMMDIYEEAACEAAH